MVPTEEHSQYDDNADDEDDDDVAVISNLHSTRGLSNKASKVGAAKATRNQVNIR